MAKRTITTLPANAAGRLSKAAAFAEGFVHSSEDTRPDRPSTSAPAGRIKLKTPLSYGEMAVGYEMELTLVAGKWRWMSTSRESPVFSATLGSNNYWGEGSELPVVRTAAGWMVSGDSMSGYLSSDEDDLPSNAVLRIGPVNNGKWRDSLNLYRAGDNRAESFEPYWQYNYAALSGWIPSDRQQDERKDDDHPKGRGIVVPCVPVGLTPVRAAYEPFKGLAPDGDPIPDELYQAMGADDSPSWRTLWGPSSTGKLTRTFTAMKLYWWEWSSPEYVIKTETVRDANPEYDPDEFVYGGICNRIAIDPENPSNTIANPDWNPQSIVCQETVEAEREYWATDPSCGDSVSTGIPADEDPPSRRSVMFIAIDRWWAGSGALSMDLGWFNNHWQYNGTSWEPTSNQGYWGPLGVNWWVTTYGDFPPSQDDIDRDFPQDAPDEPEVACGGVVKRKFYGWILWEWGFEALGAVGQPDDHACMITGPMKAKSRIVVVDGEPPESSVSE